MHNDKVMNLIANYLLEFEYNYNEKGESVIDWLLIGMGIENVTLDIGRYEDDLFMCKPQRAWLLRENAILKRIVTALTKFQYCWGALEMLMSEVIPCLNNKEKMKQLYQYLREKEIYKKLPNAYYKLYKRLISELDKVEEIRDLLSRNNITNDTPYANRPENEYPELGIFVVYKIRNRFAHGALKMPKPHEDLDIDDVGMGYIDNKIIDLCTSVVLMTILMLLMADAEQQNYIIAEDFTFIDVQESKSAVSYLKELFGFEEERNNLQLEIDISYR